MRRFLQAGAPVGAIAQRNARGDNPGKATYRQNGAGGQNRSGPSWFVAGLPEADTDPLRHCDPHHRKSTNQSSNRDAESDPCSKPRMTGCFSSRGSLDLVDSRVPTLASSLAYPRTQTAFIT